MALKPSAEEARSVGCGEKRCCASSENAFESWLGFGDPASPPSAPLSTAVFSFSTADADRPSASEIGLSSAPETSLAFASPARETVDGPIGVRPANSILLAAATGADGLDIGADADDAAKASSAASPAAGAAVVASAARSCATSTAPLLGPGEAKPGVFDMWPC